MVEANSKALSLLLNDVHYLFDMDDLTHMIECLISMTDGPNSLQRKSTILDTILRSRAMKRIYY